MMFDAEDFEAYGVIVETVELPQEPPPQMPPECWIETKPDPERAMAAVRAMCGGL